VKKLKLEIEQLDRAAANKAIADNAAFDAVEIARITAMVAEAQAKWANTMPDGTPIRASFICDSLDSGVLTMVKKESIDKIIATLKPRATVEIREKYSSFLIRCSIDDIIERVFRPVFEECVDIQAYFDSYILHEPSIRAETNKV